MADVISHYVKSAIGEQLTMSDQIPIIIADLQASKTAMIEDITHGA